MAFRDFHFFSLNLTVLDLNKPLFFRSSNFDLMHIHSF